MANTKQVSPQDRRTSVMIPTWKQDNCSDSLSVLCVRAFPAVLPPVRETAMNLLNI